MATNVQKNSLVKKLLSTAANAKKVASETISGAAGTINDYKSAYKYNNEANKNLKKFTNKKAEEHAVDMNPGIKKKIATWLDSTSMYDQIKAGKSYKVREYNARVAKDLKRRGY